jgi:hypothetical protein
MTTLQVTALIEACAILALLWVGFWLLDQLDNERRKRRPR